MDNEGKMGNLDKKTRCELIDLLTRQQKLLQNTRRLNLLPDKGEKIKVLVKKLENLIGEREMAMNHTTDLFDKMDITGAVIPRVSENIFHKVDFKMDKPGKTAFKPNRCLRSVTIPADLVAPPAPPSRGNTPAQGVDPRPPEVSAVSIPPLKHPGVQTINLGESARLLQGQKRRVEELRAREAAMKLAERFHDVKIGPYIPAEPGSYRNQESEDETDSDSDDDEL